MERTACPAVGNDTAKPVPADRVAATARSVRVPPTLRPGTARPSPIIDRLSARSVQLTTCHHSQPNPSLRLTLSPIASPLCQSEETLRCRKSKNVVARLLKTRRGQPMPDCPCLSPRSGILPTALAVARAASTRDGQVLPCILQQKPPKCIGHLEDSAIGQVSNLFIGQVSSLSIGQMSSLSSWSGDQFVPQRQGYCLCTIGNTQFGQNVADVSPGR